MNTQDFIIDIVEDDNGHIVGVSGSFPLEKKQEGGCYFVRCSVFKTLGYSTSSFEEALEDHSKDLEIFFTIHNKRGTLKSALHSLNVIKRNDSHYRLPDIPAYLLDRVHNDTRSFQLV